MTAGLDRIVCWTEDVRIAYMQGEVTTEEVFHVERLLGAALPPSYWALLWREADRLRLTVSERHDGPAFPRRVGVVVVDDDLEAEVERLIALEALRGEQRGPAHTETLRLARAVLLPPRQLLCKATVAS